MAASVLTQNDSRPLVLLVEDEVLVRMTLTRMLETGGFRVTPVAQADEALEVVAALPDIRAVVTDVNLSNSSMDGFELARRINKHWAVGVVVVSGRADPEQTELPSGVAFVAKPVHQATLVTLVRNAVESQERLVQLRRGDEPSGLETSVSKAVADRHLTTRMSGIAVDPETSRALTPRQHEVLALLVQGKSNRDIAEAMNLSENTVKVHLAAIFRVLGVSSRTEALVVGLKRLSAE